jgi:hypothetical protein
MSEPVVIIAITFAILCVVFGLGFFLGVVVGYFADKEGKR